jgi:hypothetical protein
MSTGDSGATDKDEGTAAGLSFTDNISLAWQPVDYTLDDRHLALANDSNEIFLRAVSAIGEFARDVPEDGQDISQEMARLDIKMNLLLDLVSQLIYAQLAIPDITRVTISSSEIEWTGDELPAPEQTVLLKIYIQRGTPKPLCFYGTVISSAADHAAGHARVKYIGLRGSAQAWLDKLIFRHHRREIAYKKSIKSAD